MKKLFLIKLVKIVRMTEVTPLSVSKCIDDVSINGYPIELFLPNPILEHLKCELCHGIFIEPVDLKCGDKCFTYCKNCLSNHLEEKKTCPVCKSKVHEDQKADIAFSVSKITLVVNGVLNKVIESLDVKCKFQPEGCTWTGKLKDLYGYEEKNHLVECKHNYIKCTNSDCKEIMHGSKLTNHLNECPFTIVECECEESMMRKEMKEHIDTKCPYALIECKLCKIKMKRNLVDKHLNKSCSEVEVDCPYKRYGCDVKIKRKDVETHFNQDLVKHWNLRLRRSNPVLLSMHVYGNATENACEQKIEILGVPYLVTNYRNLSTLQLSISFENLGDRSTMLRFSLNVDGTEYWQAGQFNPGERKHTFSIPKYHGGTIHTHLNNIEEWIPF